MNFGHAADAWEPVHATAPTLERYVRPVSATPESLRGGRASSGASGLVSDWGSSQEPVRCHLKDLASACELCKAPRARARAKW